MATRGGSLKARIGLLALVLFFPVVGSSQTAFYEGKTINLVVGFAPGGLADMSNRAIVPFLKQYVPGQPDIILQYMPGGGGRKAANHIQKVARPDGLTVGWAGSTLVANSVLGLPGVEYDIDQLIYVGTSNYRSHYLFFTRKEAGLNSLEKLRAASGVRMGALSVGEHLYVQGRLFAYLLGLKEPRFVAGYSGPELDVAVESGEVDSRQTSADRILRENPEWLDKMDFHVIFEIPKGGREPHFAHLAELETFAKSEKERKLLELWRTLRSAGQPYVVPPGTPRERVEILRGAFRKSFKDPRFVKQFEKLTGSIFVRLMPEDLEKMIKERSREPEIVELLKTLAGAGPLPVR